MNTVWVLHIHHDYGDDYWICESEELAYEEADEYVVDWWQDELPDVPIPPAMRERIPFYFDNTDGEYCNIREEQVRRRAKSES